MPGCLRLEWARPARSFVTGPSLRAALLSGRAERPRGERRRSSGRGKPSPTDRACLRGGATRHGRLVRPWRQEQGSLPRHLECEEDARREPSSTIRGKPGGEKGTDEQGDTEIGGARPGPRATSAVVGAGHTWSGRSRRGSGLERSWQGARQALGCRGPSSGHTATATRHLAGRRGMWSHRTGTHRLADPDEVGLSRSGPGGCSHDLPSQSAPVARLLGRPRWRRDWGGRGGKRGAGGLRDRRRGLGKGGRNAVGRYGGCSSRGRCRRERAEEKCPTYPGSDRAAGHDQQVSQPLRHHGTHPLGDPRVELSLLRSLRMLSRPGRVSTRRGRDGLHSHVPSQSRGGWAAASEEGVCGRRGAGCLPSGVPSRKAPPLDEPRRLPGASEAVGAWRGGQPGPPLGGQSSSTTIVSSRTPKRSCSRLASASSALPCSEPMADWKSSIEAKERSAIR